MKNIILVGPPGSGKGTQAKKLSEKLNLPVFSTGDILRNEIENKTQIGQKVDKIVKSGDLVGDKLISKIVFSQLEKKGSDFILDGFPRNKKQAKALVRFFKQKNWPAILINFSLPDEIAIERISGRRTCRCGRSYHIKYNLPKIEGICDECGQELKRRDDEDPEVVKERLKVYHQQTEPLINYINKQKKIEIKYLEIDANKSIKEIHNDIISKL